MSETTILVADDHDSLRLLVRTMLTRTAGWTVMEATDGDQALQLFRSHHFDLVILDQRMPKLTGTEVARTMRAEHFDGPILLFSAYLNPDVQDEVSELGLIPVEKGAINDLAAIAGRALAAD